MNKAIFGQWRLGLAGLALLGMAWLAGCTTTEDEGGSEPGNFHPPFANTTYEMEVLDTAGNTSPVHMEPGGTRIVGDHELTVMTLSNTQTGLPLGMEVVADITPEEIVIGGVDLGAELSGIDILLQPDPPAVIHIDAPVGEPQVLVVDGHLEVIDPSINADQYLPLEIDYTVVAQNTVAHTPMGDVPGCTQLTFSTSKLGLSATGDVWVKDGVGMVHAEVDAVPFGSVYAGVAGYFGFVEDGDSATIQSEGIIGPGRTQFHMSTYDVNHEYDADKMQHAKMYLEARWADGEKAKTTEPLPINQSFSTAWGWFPSFLTMSEVGVLHAGEWDQGYNYWIAFADEAAKNEPGENGIVYNADANYAPSTTNVTGDVHVGAFIHYKLYRP